jgi:hypothetical protein
MAIDSAQMGLGSQKERVQMTHTDEMTNAAAMGGDPLVGPIEEPLVEESNEEESGKLIVVGDGLTSPLYEVRASRLAKGGRPFTPNVVRIWPDRVEDYQHHALLHKNTQAIGYAQVAQVTINRGLRWSTIRVESTGGQVVTLAGVPKRDADQIKAVLDAKVNEARVGPQQAAPVATSSAVDVTDRLVKLGEMRTAGLITDEEFAAQKARLLG